LWGSADGKAYSVSRFTEDLGNGFFLMMRLCPEHGEDLDVSHIVSLAELAVREGAEIFADWKMLAESDCSPDDEGEDAADAEPRHAH
jgi:hypothetical protein